MKVAASRPKLLGIAFALLVVIVLAAGGLFYVHLQNLPVYEDGQEAPVGGIAVNTLKQGDMMYISGRLSSRWKSSSSPQTSHGADW